MIFLLHIAICDDEKIICDQLINFITDYQEHNHTEIAISVFYNGEDIYERLEKGQFYDLIFMDIEMYQISGIDVSKYIRNELENEMTQIVFVSSKQHYAMDLFAIRPLDFIIKPINYDRIAFCLDFISKRKKQQKTVFTYQVSGVTKVISLEDILYFHSSARKVFIKTVEGADEFYGKLDDIEKQLQNNLFLRIHKSTLINYMWVRFIKDPDITMKNGDVLQISYPKRKSVLENLNELRKKGITQWK